MTTRVSASVLANTAVTPGTYGGSDVFSIVTVDQQGRLTTAANTSLKNTGVSAGNYGGGVTSSNFQLPVISVDAQGRLSAAANVTVTNTSIVANTGFLTANAAVGVVALGLATTSVIAGNYGSSTLAPILTIDAYGRITGASTTLITGGSAGIGATTYTRQSYTATAGQTAFTVTAGYTVGYLQVYLNGVLLNASDYTASNGTSFTLASGASVNDIVEAFSYTVTLVNNVSPSYAGGQGGSAGVVLYQSAANTTSNTAVGTSTYLLQSNGTGAPTWVNPATLTVSTFNSTTSNSQFFSIGIGTPASSANGEIRATNNITAYYSSDNRFKENIQDIPNALEKVDVIGGKLFDWIDEYIKDHGGEDGYFMQKADFGVIAQDVQSVFPIATRTRPDGSLAVDYEKLCALAFAAIKELKNEVEVLKGQIK